jgi:AcrR family transcriptional regulator
MDRTKSSRSIGKPSRAKASARCPTLVDRRAGAATTARGAERLQRLSRAAANMFLDHGYEAVSVDQLIAQVGGSRRNVYHHFGGKLGLFVQAVQDLCAEATLPLKSKPLAEAGLREALTRYARHTLELLLQPRALGLHRLMVTEGTRDPALGQALMEAGCDAATQALASWMASRQAAGELRLDLPPFSLANHFLCLLVSRPQQQAMASQLPADWALEGFNRHVSEVVELFLGGAMSHHPATP